MQLTLDIPDKYFAHQSPTEMIQLLKLNTAIDLYKNGGMSSGAASEFVGMDKYEFLYECRKRGVEPQTYESIEELNEELAMLEENLK
jgi:predicted HTH domain antitoxin